MTLRTGSRASQWAVWTGVALVVAVVYVIFLRVGFNLSGAHLLGRIEHRTLLVAVALFWCLAYETRWDGVRREKKANAEGRGQRRNSASGSSRPHERARVPAATPRRKAPDAAVVAGEALFTEARELPHQPIPDFEFDGRYLGLLGKSSAAGYAPASEKLGEYAMRRAAWVEAYYWMSLAGRQGMLNLDGVRRDIRVSWTLAGRPDESENVNEMFSPEAGSIGRALLHLDSGHETAKAKEFLKANHPGFLAN